MLFDEGDSRRFVVVHIDTAECHLALSAPLRKEKERNKARKHNLSLDAFVTGLEALRA